MKEKIIEKIKFLLSQGVRPVTEYRDSPWGKNDVGYSIGEIVFLIGESRRLLVKGVDSELSEEEYYEVIGFVEEQIAIIEKQEMEEYLESREVPVRIVRTVGVPYESFETLSDEFMRDINKNMRAY